MAETVALETGTPLGGGRYEVVRVLGQGGFGITYEAGDSKLHRNVAIKEFFMAGSSRQGTTVKAPFHMKDQVHERMDRIRDEARALARFRHPAIVTVHEFFEENESIYVVMELLEGRTLRSIIDESDGPLPEDQVVRFGTDIAAALGAVHQQNLLHRDVKPENVMLMDDGQLVLVDFGTAREFTVDQSSQMSQTLSPGYAPIEQYTARGRFGPSTDLYALGATMYHLATGTFPTPSLDRFTGQDLRPPHEVNPALSPHLSQAIMWAMNVEAADRPQSADAFLSAVRGGAIPDSGSVTRAVPAAAPPPAATRQVGAGATDAPTPGATKPAGAQPAASVRPPVRMPEQRPKKRRRRSAKRAARRAGRNLINIIITIAIAIGATFAVAWYFNSQSDDPAQPQPAVEIVDQLAGAPYGWI